MTDPNVREALIHTICAHIKQWSDADGVEDHDCEQCPATVQTSMGEGVQMCRLNAEKAARDIAALVSLAAIPEPGAGEATQSPGLREALLEISQLTTALRQGGPDPMDLQELSEALEHATNLAHEALAAPSPALDPTAWYPIENKPPWQTCEERGIYTHNGDGLFYFKATHWRPALASPAPSGEPLSSTDQTGNDLASLRQAIIDHTHGDLFWIGEILLGELEKETGFTGAVSRPDRVSTPSAPDASTPARRLPE